jgi:serine/threonine protein kinase
MKTCSVCSHENPDNVSVCEKCRYSFSSTQGEQKTRFGLSDLSVLTPGMRIANRYEIVRELGRGGMGLVFLVRDIMLRNQDVALKMIHPDLLNNDEALRRFEEEVIISQRLSHQNIIHVYNLDIWQDVRFFTMEYIKGRTLRSWITDRHGNQPAFTLPEIMAVFAPLLKALAYAHQQTIHRDIKPENIMLLGDFPSVTVKVLDFGIAKVMSAERFSKTSMVLGTADYISPEQRMLLKTIDHRSDLYAAGMILYEMLTGMPLLPLAPMPGQIMDGLPPDIDDLLSKALAVKPDDRFNNAMSMLRALSTINKEKKVQPLTLQKKSVPSGKLSDKPQRLRDERLQREYLEEERRKLEEKRQRLADEKVHFEDEKRQAKLAAQRKKLGETPKRLEKEKLSARSSSSTFSSSSLSSDPGIIFKNGLEWYVGPDRDTTWAEAKKWVENLSVGGGGWRMPTRSELEGLYEKGRGTRNMDPAFKTTGWYVWSGETKRASSAWIFDFFFGPGYWIDRNFSSSWRAFAVRSRR